MDDIKDRRGYCELKEEAVDRTMWRNRFAWGFGPVVWQITDDDDDEALITPSKQQSLQIYVYSCWQQSFFYLNKQNFTIQELLWKYYWNFMQVGKV